ncbi:hypothetical protein V9T40_007524 [Parthenolecanium corni]|uniref:Uncharacterized protein n=1 Tax=Parthenolecanium corni TaxID=536013 RepID=A0AAN9TJG3_9HEMI
METNAQEEDEDDWSSDGEPQESDDNNKSQMAAVAAVAAAAAMAAAPPSKNYGSGIGASSDLYLQTEAAAAASEALKLTTHRQSAPSLGQSRPKWKRKSRHFPRPHYFLPVGRLVGHREVPYWPVKVKAFRQLFPFPFPFLFLFLFLLQRHHSARPYI